ncbi:MAG: hypothetical protein IK061_09560 [Desulfovibrio sp.]|nr:hypothetical protein [Desulfovibrio sp.]
MADHLRDDRANTAGVATHPTEEASTENAEEINGEPLVEMQNDNILSLSLFK